MNPTQNQTISGSQHLGRRAFSFIVSKHINFAIIVLLVAIVASLYGGVIGSNALVGQATVALWVLFLIGVVYAFIVGALIYSNYTFSLEDDAFKIRRGVISKKETAIPYRQIRDVNIERSLAQQLAGVSKLVILTVGEESDSRNVSESVLPEVDNIDKKLAIIFQAELLKRANVQKISQQ